MANQIAEQSGHGVPMIVAKYGKESFDFSSGAILVTIKFAFSFRHVEINESFGFDEHTTTQENSNTTQETIKQQIVEIISNNGKITLNEMAEKLKLSRDGVKYHITELQKEGKVSHEGSTKTGQWVIIK